jgi:FKBP-type peptidyl-prolyl cis-trans isomerase SlyD
MRVRPGCVVALDYVLRLDDGAVIDASSPEAPLTIVHGEGQVLPGLEQALEGLAPGDTRELVLPPGEGFGHVDASAVEEVPRAAFPDDAQLEPGRELVLEGPGGESVRFVITAVDGDRVLVDLRHPLAGRTLHLEVTVREVRAAEPLDAPPA